MSTIYDRRHRFGPSAISGGSSSRSTGSAIDNVQPIAAIPQLVELNFGHFRVGEAIFTGFEDSVTRMRELMDLAR